VVAHLSSNPNAALKKKKKNPNKVFNRKLVKEIKQVIQENTMEIDWKSTAEKYLEVLEIKNMQVHSEPQSHYIRQY
jgi:anti-sigma28 factor (negative regulator of flagellin synthesis)